MEEVPAIGKEKVNKPNKKEDVKKKSTTINKNKVNKKNKKKKTKNKLVFTLLKKQQ